MNLFDFSVVYRDFWAILEYLPVTLKLTVISAFWGLVIGFLLAVLHMKRIPVLRRMIELFISIIRGTPIIVQLYVTYFGIPIFFKYVNYYYGTNIGINAIPAIFFAYVALALNQAAFNAVTIEAALAAVNKGEIEAAAALGMTSSQRMLRIILPEAVELAIPSLGNTFIGLIKGTSLAFSCSVIEMTASGKLMAARDYRYFEAYVALAIIYWLVTVAVEFLIHGIIQLVKIPDTPRTSENLNEKRRLPALVKGRKKTA